ncbi:antirepressor protein [Bibersteinia trehalosi USDA-ARS-USMARC-190]|uniref:Antirepressor protein n=1 Tax=Bibersteinia trehalosi USDA-ARS-USMARC-190 TaxID=1263832 RepID=W0RD67_BIBTR|nr:P22AR C-terminal domain-containing protein [Bibersteinia trehalosi]AHG87328.1 antirepressor protein [Bibersteinia trehalosi USDA-ARS-USMARC-190]
MTTQTQLSTFNFETHSIRVIAINNEPWFLSVDICNALNIANSRDAISKLDEDEYQTLNLKDTVGLTDSIANQVQSVGIVSESGMYTLILRCREAVKKGSVPHRFRKWVTAKVLPQIRKTGQYSQNNQQIAPLVEPKITMELTKKEWLRFASMWFALYNSLEVLATLEKPLRAIGSPFGTTAYTHATEYQTTLGVMKRILEPMLADFEVDPFEEAHYHKALTTLRQYQPKGSSGLVRI